MQRKIVAVQLTINDEVIPMGKEPRLRTFRISCHHKQPQRPVHSHEICQKSQFYSVVDKPAGKGEGEPSTEFSIRPAKKK